MSILDADVWFRGYNYNSSESKQICKLAHMPIWRQQQHFVHLVKKQKQKPLPSLCWGSGSVVPQVYLFCFLEYNSCSVFNLLHKNESPLHQLDCIYQ